MLDNFYKGTEFKAYKIFGAHPGIRDGRAGVRFCVYAPQAAAVGLIGEFNGWNPYMMEQDNGVFRIFVENAAIGMMYKYRIYHIDGTFTDKTDPYGFYMERQPGNASIITDLSGYRFSDGEWMESRNKNYDKPMNIYELHAGSWKGAGGHKVCTGAAEGAGEHKVCTGAAEGAGGHKVCNGNRPVTYRELSKQLIKYLKENNYTHVELMPLLEHPLDKSWGYQPTGFFSVTARYGTVKDFMYFVNECHRAGIGVIMDFVAVHFAVDDYGLGNFDGTALYEYPDERKYTQWGSYAFNFEKPEVRSFLCSAVSFWFEVFHIDGIRVDAVSNILYYGGDSSRWNRGGTEFIKLLNSGIKMLYPDVMMIAEDSSDYLKVTAPVEYDGLGFDYKWDMGWMTDTINFFKTPPIERKYHAEKITFSMYYFYNELFILPASHDENVHGRATILGKMWGDYDAKLEQIFTFYTYMFAHPGKKLNFMGNELGHIREWSEGRGCDWKLLENEKHQRLKEYFNMLSELYVHNQVLYSGEYNSSTFSWLTTDIAGDCVAVIRRKNWSGSIYFVMNFDNRYVENYTFGTDEEGRFRKIADSNLMLYNGNMSDGEMLTAYRDGASGREYSVTTSLAPFSSKIFVAV